MTPESAAATLPGRGGGGTAGPALQIEGLSKQFDGNYALHPLDWEVKRGEVHALCGQNGSGKSTMIKCLAGYYRPDSGRVRLFGRELDLPVRNPAEHGIAVIHQDLGLAPEMTVLENIGVATGYGTRGFGWVRDRQEAKACREIAERLGIELPLNTLVADLSPAQRALVGLVRAVRALGDGHEGHLFILDEPTASLSHSEAAQVTAMMRSVAELGSSVIFVSHRLSEVLDDCDSVTVLRDGKRVLTRSTAGLTRSDLVADILGRRLTDYYPDPPERSGATPAQLVLENVSGGVVKDLSVTVEKGEIVGFTGLAGMGHEELPLVLAGKLPRTGGTVTVDGTTVEPNRPRAAIAAGLALVPGNRHRDGVWLDASAAENVTLPSLGSFTKFGVATNWRKERSTAVDLVEESGAVPAQPHWPIRQFSGGNQQKIVLSKWLHLDPTVLLLDEPTQGVDAGASRQLLDRVADLAADGASVLVFSGDHEQLAAICHRVLVLHHGEVVAELPRAELSEQALLEACEQKVEVVA
ncbi:sugar ABC transporter ATP-binding protein [Gordonia alkanivorans]|uniref:sugar ABC transporter ATP-binding protein n=1 Tax=Gordonia alkanivorans TaxID=84096 RepID=UPI00244A8EF1|nr:sugar ABC transporter ATP-binding protein [Gordonia alkanivorans]MDH3007514.1 sugar ABC transporter ATP-binding protein [Gordonia alkanivorans]MDH3015297.1 sugar ABC transporter ATP-binding protein [Gordonia alkanivorans]MDH3039893.1 sugar ABC transporter ATP-binding protein [Gordonia alkanivorans]MDH3047161.1 sugar ABC transporter ATP-binding protein [Gordonia alkanivorans]